MYMKPASWNGQLRSGIHSAAALCDAFSELAPRRAMLEEVTGALRIYTATMNESSPHFHLHMVPRYAEMPHDAKAWAVFGLQGAATRGEVHVDEETVERIVVAYREALRVNPPHALASGARA